MAGTETKIRSALDISAAITAATRNGEKLAELHARTTRQDEQLDRLETAVGKLVVLREQSEKRAEARTDLLSKALDFLKNPALLAALAGGSLSLGGSELCASARSHQAEPPAVSVDERAGDTGE